MENQTSQNNFMLLGLLMPPEFEFASFLLFLFIYVMTLSVNLFIISLIFTDHHLHTPMYFFLGNLASMDICYSSVTVPRLLSDFFHENKTIPYSGCLTQIFFFLHFICSDLYLLGVMSYDRYVAICDPLHYSYIMSINVCALLALGVWVLGFVYSLVHTLFILRLTFCGRKIIQNFYCDLPQLFKLSCTDTLPNILLIFLFGGVVGFSAFGITFVPYIYIIRTVLKIKTIKGKIKGFSTCTSHLTVVFIFYSTLLFTYFRPSTNYTFAGDRLVSVVYAVITPVLNPLIFSLRNKDLKGASKRVILRTLLNNMVRC